MKNHSRPRINLRFEREERGLSIEQVAEEARIPFRYIEALETGDLNKVQRGPYLRSFKQQYLRYLGLPTNAVLYFKMQPKPRKQKKMPKRHQTTTSTTTTIFYGPSFGRLMASSAIIAIIIVLGLRITSAFVDKRKTRKAQHTTQKETTEKKEPKLATKEKAVPKEKKTAKRKKDLLFALETFISASPPEDPTTRALPAGKSSLSLQSRLPLKAEIVVDDKEEQLQLKPNKEKNYEFGKRLEFSAKSIDHLRISYNGNRIKPQGSLTKERKLVFVQDRQDL